MDLKIDDAPAKAVRRGTLLTTREKQWAQSRAQMLKFLADAERTRAEAKLARQQAHEHREHISASVKSRKVNFRKIATVFTAILMSATVFRIAYVGYTRPRATPASSAVVPATRVAHAPHQTVLTGKPPLPGDVQFKLSMSRLQDALDSLPEDEPEIVREVNQKHPGGPRPCPLEWINGEAALSLDGDIQHLPPSLMEAVNQCADAVEKFRAEREWILKAEESSK